MFVKIFEQIFDSSIAADRELRHFFIDLLILADADGVVDRTPLAIANRTGWPVESVQKYISELMKPDVDSRSPNDDGRRLIPLGSDVTVTGCNAGDIVRRWGWKIVNYAHYRSIESDRDRREKARLRTQKWRERKALQKRDVTVTGCDAGDGKQKQKQKEKEKQPEGLAGSLENPKEIKGDTVTVEEAKRSLSNAYHRDDATPWNYSDETQLLELMKHPAFTEQLVKIVLSKNGGEPYMPRSLGRLLETWYDVLDRLNNPEIERSNGAPKKRTLSMGEQTTRELERKSKYL